MKEYSEHTFILINPTDFNLFMVTNLIAIGLQIEMYEELLF